MIYRINRTNYCDHDTLAVNRLPARSYFIPYPDRVSAMAAEPLTKRYGSPKAVCLNGDWDFLFYPEPAALPGELDTDAVTFSKMPVPGCWQFHGVGKPAYINDRYPFPCDPPRIPQDGPVGEVWYWTREAGEIKEVRRTPEGEYNYAGVYRKKLTLRFEQPGVTAEQPASAGETTVCCRPGSRLELSFLGVAPCVDLYCNGSFAGYAEGSHNTAEFDLTGLLHEGENELLAVVRRWCTGSYLECQDMFRNTGIFRDVLLRVSDPFDIRDISFKTIKNDDGTYDAAVECSFYDDAAAKAAADKACGEDGTSVPVLKAVLEGPDGFAPVRLDAPAGGGCAVLNFRHLKVREWNAEQPVLYDLCLEIPGTCVRLRVGFKDVRIDGDVFLINGKKVKLHGVNHHDTSPTGGYVLTPQEIERDVLLCRDFNIDTIRTSHYPPDPLLLELCAEAGIYVVDEADLETHGTFYHRLPPDFDLISNDPAWARHYLDRAERLYMRDKLQPCVIMWSLGNEAGGTYCQDRMYDWIRERSTLPVHYEGAAHCSRHAYDVASQMYPHPSVLHRVGEKQHEFPEFNDRPYFLCEYIHAMGVGPGGGEEYWKEIDRYDNLMGGCVWEMVDHAVQQPDGSFTYGGDHGEWMHDGNFCVDGLFYPDRTPSTGALAVRHLYRPIRVTWLGDDRFEIFNTRSFTSGTRYGLRLSWSDGTEEMLDVEAGPRMRQIITLPVAEHVDACDALGTDTLLSIDTIDFYDCVPVDTSQIELKRNLPAVPEGPGGVPLAEVLSIEDGKPRIRLDALAGCTDAAAGTAPENACNMSGDPARRNSAGEALLTASDPWTILFRAPTDNDRDLVSKAQLGRYIRAKTFTESVEQTPDEVRVTARIEVPCEFDGSLSAGIVNDGQPVGMVSTLKKGVLAADPGAASGAEASGCGCFTVTDTYRMTDRGLLVTSVISPASDAALLPAWLPRFGKAFALPAEYDEAGWFGRAGETYADLREHQPIRQCCADVRDMTEPNIRPQESGNRMDCRRAVLEGGPFRVAFTAVEAPFELGIKPYTDLALLAMKHRCDETCTGTYVTVSAFQMGVGTGSCGPETDDAYCYPADGTYELRFLITAEKDR